MGGSCSSNTTGDVNLLPADLRVTVIRERAALQSRMHQFERFNDVLVGAIRDLDLPRQELLVSGALKTVALTAADIWRSPRMRHGWVNVALVFGNQSDEVRGMLESIRAIADATEASL